MAGGAGDMLVAAASPEMRQASGERETRPSVESVGQDFETRWEPIWEWNGFEWLKIQGSGAQTADSVVRLWQPSSFRRVSKLDRHSNS